jgi:hypothetical protein
MTDAIIAVLKKLLEPDIEASENQEDNTIYPIIQVF